MSRGKWGKAKVAVALWVLAAGSAAWAAEVERLSVLAGREVVGHVVATVDGPQVEIDYAVSNNGRGPRHREVITLGEGGLPTSWSIDGTALFGNAISERFDWANGRAVWRSEADSGERASPSVPLYVANDASPWSLGLYARALMNAPGGRREALPGGALTLTKLRDVVLGEGEQRQTLGVYMLTGLDLTPEFFALDAEGELFATFAARGSVVVRQGYEDQGARLSELASELESARAEEIQRQVAHRPAGPVRIRNVRIFDPRAGRLGEPVSVLVRGDRIERVEPIDVAAGACESVVDGQGGALVPGLHDMHSHSSVWSSLYYVAAGVLQTRDQGNNNDFLLNSLLPRLESGTLAGPYIVRNGFLEGRSQYSARNGFIPDTLEEALENVRWYRDHGYYQVKIYNSMNPQWVPAIAAEAHRVGLGVSGHVPAFMTADAAIEAGYDDIAHINQLMLSWLIAPEEDTRTPLRLTAMERARNLDLSSERVQHTVRLMREHEVALDTTSVILERLMVSRAGTVQPGDAFYLDHMPIGYQRYRRRSFVDPARHDDYVAAFQKVLGTMRLLHDNGIRLLPGTDDATGFTVHRELELYTLAGISPAETLRLATLGSAEFLRRSDQWGTIEPGKLANFFLVPGDPTADINAVRRIRMVMRGGTVYFPSEIYEALGIRPFAEPVALVPPGAPAQAPAS